jgi:hypothetical protein
LQIPTGQQRSTESETMAGSQARPRTDHCANLYIHGVCTRADKSFSQNTYRVTHIPVRRAPGQICCRISVKYHRPVEDRRSHSQSGINSTRTSTHRTEFGMDDNYDFESAGEYNALTLFKTQTKNIIQHYLFTPMPKKGKKEIRHSL